MQNFNTLNFAFYVMSSVALSKGWGHQLVESERH